MGVPEEAQEIGCRWIVITQGGVISLLFGIIVKMALAWWKGSEEEKKILRDRVSVLDVALTAARNKRGESP